MLYHAQWAANCSPDEIRCIHEALYGWEQNEFSNPNFQGSLTALFIENQSQHHYHVRDITRNTDIDVLVADFLSSLYIGRFPEKKVPTVFNNKSCLQSDLHFTQKDVEKLFFVLTKILKIKDSTMPDRWWRLTLGDVKKELAKRQLHYFLYS